MKKVVLTNVAIATNFGRGDSYKKLWTLDAIIFTLIVATCYIIIIGYLSTVSAQSSEVVSSTTQNTSYQLTQYMQTCGGGWSQNDEWVGTANVAQTYIYSNSESQTMIWASLSSQNFQARHASNTSKLSHLVENPIQVYTDWLDVETITSVVNGNVLVVPGYVIINGCTSSLQLVLSGQQRDSESVMLYVVTQLQQPNLQYSLGNFTDAPVVFELTARMNLPTTASR